MSRCKTVLVTGATGTVGPHLAETLLRRGDRVRVLARTSPPPGLLPASDVLTIEVGEINDADAVRRAMRDVDVVYHLAARLHLSDPGPEMRREYERVNVEGTRCVAQAAQAADVRRVVLFSTINVYGCSHPGLIFDETSTPRPDSWYAETKLRAEAVVLQETSAVVLRPAAIYGPRMKGNYALLLESLKRGRFMPIGSGRNRRSLIYIQDICDAAILAADHPAAAGRIYNATDGCLHTFREVTCAICAALDRPPPRWHLPVLSAYGAASMAELTLHAFGRQSPVRRSTIRKITEDMAVSGSRIGRELGFAPRFGLEAGWREVVAAQHESISS